MTGRQDCDHPWSVASAERLDGGDWIVLENCSWCDTFRERRVTPMEKKM